MGTLRDTANVFLNLYRPSVLLKAARMTSAARHQRPATLGMMRHSIFRVSPSINAWRWTISSARSPVPGGPTAVAPGDTVISDVGVASLQEYSKSSSMEGVSAPSTGVHDPGAAEDVSGKGSVSGTGNNAAGGRPTGASSESDGDGDASCGKAGSRAARASARNRPIVSSAGEASTGRGSAASSRVSSNSVSGRRPSAPYCDNSSSVGGQLKRIRGCSDDVR